MGRTPPEQASSTASQPLYSPRITWLNLGRDSSANSSAKFLPTLFGILYTNLCLLSAARYIYVTSAPTLAPLSSHPSIYWPSGLVLFSVALPTQSSFHHHNCSNHGAYNQKTSSFEPPYGRGNVGGFWDSTSGVVGV